MFKFKITYRHKQKDYFCTDNYTLEATSILEAAKLAESNLDETLKATIISIEREVFLWD